jgi:hypothetical protein
MFKKFIFAFLITLASLGIASAKAKNQKGFIMKPWFSSTTCIEVEIKQIKSKEGKDHQSLKFKDVDSIKRIINHINQISTSGDKMMSMIVHTQTDLIFDCGSEKIKIEVMNGRIKTPTTGFNSSKKDLDLEESLNTDINNLLHPAYGQKILKIKDLPIAFEGFTITYRGEEVDPEELDGPTIGPVSTLTFTLQPKKGKSEDLKIVSVQNPPEPLDFTVGEVKLTLETFLDSKGKRIDPDYFVVVPQK